MKAVCVSIHDVAPPTWPACSALLQQIREVADIPVTLLVVPHYHRRADSSDPHWEQALARRLHAGDELALHGWCHLDEGTEPSGVFDRLRRNTYTAREGEFASLTEEEARRRIDDGLAWFADRRLPVHGFVPPAWLLSEGSWQALHASPLTYTTTLTGFHLLQQRGKSIKSQSLVYSVRRPWARRASLIWNSVLARSLQHHRLVRLSLHPPDAWQQDVTRHWQAILGELLKARTAMTKAGFADALKIDD